MAQNSSHCFTNFHVFFCLFYHKQRLEQVFSQITCIFTNTWFIGGAPLLERKDYSRPPWRLFGFIAYRRITIKSFFHPNIKEWTATSIFCASLAKATQMLVVFIFIEWQNFWLRLGTLYMIVLNKFISNKNINDL